MLDLLELTQILPKISFHTKNSLRCSTGSSLIRVLTCCPACSLYKETRLLSDISHLAKSGQRGMRLTVESEDGRFFLNFLWKI